MSREPLAVDANGDALTDFVPASAKPPVPDPMPLALAAVWDGDRVLLGFNRYRSGWELPGGLIDPGEEPHEAAARELHEETGLRVARLEFAGYARFLLGPERRLEFAAVFRARSAPHDGFVPNDEMTALRWCPIDGEPPEGVQMLDWAMARLIRYR